MGVAPKHWFHRIFQRWGRGPLKKKQHLTEKSYDADLPDPRFQKIPGKQQPSNKQLEMQGTNGLAIHNMKIPRFMSQLASIINVEISCDLAKVKFMVPGGKWNKQQRVVEKCWVSLVAFLTKHLFDCLLLSNLFLP